MRNILVIFALVVYSTTLMAVNSVLTYTSHSSQYKPRNCALQIKSFEYSHEQNLGRIVFNGKLNVLGHEAFKGCSNLVTCTLPKTLTTIGDSAFCRCGDLTEVTIYDTLSYIGESAFERCSRLPYIQLPNKKYQTIAKSTFRSSGLKSIGIGQAVVTIGESAFEDCKQLAFVELPDRVETIDSAAFRNSGLLCVVMGSSVTTIGDEAFKGSLLTSAILSASVKTIGKEAFANTPMRTLVCYASEPPVCDVTCFEGVDTGIILYVPAKSVHKYKTTTPWNRFTNIKGK